MHAVARSRSNYHDQLTATGRANVNLDTETGAGMRIVELVYVLLVSSTFITRTVIESEFRVHECGCGSMAELLFACLRLFTLIAFVAGIDRPRTS